MTSRKLQIGDPATCSDGECGKVMRIVFDPTSSAITHLAVGRRPGEGRLVPAGYLAATAPEVMLSCSVEQFEALPNDQDSELLSGSAHGYANQQANMFTAVLTDETASGLDLRMTGANNPPQTRTFDRVPAGASQLQSSDEVKAGDDPVGHISGVGFDLRTSAITHLLVLAGPRWRRRQVAVPIDDVDHIGIGVRLRLSRQQVTALADL